MPLSAATHRGQGGHGSVVDVDNDACKGMPGACPLNRFTDFKKVAKARTRGSVRFADPADVSSDPDTLNSSTMDYMAGTVTRNHKFTVYVHHLVNGSNTNSIHPGVNTLVWKPATPTGATTFSQ